MTPGRLLFGSWNLYEFGRESTPEALARYQAIGERIRGYRPDLPMILVVQELSGESEVETATQTWTLARMAGMECGITHSVTACSYHPARWSKLGVLWRPGIRALPGSKRVPRPGDRDDWLFVAFECGGVRLQAGVAHFPPFDRESRPSMVRRFAGASRLAGLPTWLGFDFNATSAARTRFGRFYDPDPFQARPWQPAYADQCARRRTLYRRRMHPVDRSAGQALIDAGLRDIAPALRAPWRPTAGFPPFAGDLREPRRLDILATNSAAALAATVGYHVDDFPSSNLLSDHRLTVAEIDLALLTT
ncbi:hypothetical protein [Catenuloplanes atrovinosus]|uniref:Endonuclease/exonuclease/phosphatase domain-containing protein n=1 Tax=Catenuloplanes atrovinosus TaxID=137266 RepID=A0AAE4CB50_9ACTN|nr:hypothetical protein [Catenuloplanes atrovinosus]MDR7277692.1 hypothetical protein [Catenuloplanes atrovinosus]